MGLVHTVVERNMGGGHVALFEFLCRMHFPPCVVRCGVADAT